MNLAELRKLLTEWLSELKTWSPKSWDDYILDDEDYRDYLYPDHKGNEKPREDFQLNENRLHVVLFTNDHRYHIAAHTAPEGGDDYLGCLASVRKPRAGEAWTRGNDLPDGPLTRETWDSIIHRIVGYELVAKIKPQAPISINRERSQA